MIQENVAVDLTVAALGIVACSFFFRLIENAVRIDPLPYEAIVERTGKPRLRQL
jgi:hypothetical protein